MKQKQFTVTSEEGLHARPAKEFAEKLQEFESTAEIEYEGEKVNGKSVLGLMSLGVAKGGEITVTIEGQDEEEAFNALEDLMKKMVE